jgi:hypothetical protein
VSLDFQTRLYARQRIAEQQRRKLFEYELEQCGGQCSSCGTPWSLPTPGCVKCSDRERSRGRKRSSGASRDEILAAIKKKQCVLCGASWSKPTDGCRTCIQRAQKRERDLRRRLHGNVVRVCSGCGVPTGERTQGCRTCFERAKKAA